MMIPGVPWQSWGSAIAGHGIKMPSPTSGKVRNHEESRNPKSGQCTYPNQDVSCPSKHLESLILYCHRSTGKLRDLGCTRWVRWFACQSGQTHSLRTWSHGPVEMTWVFTAINWWIFPVRYVHLKTNRLFFDRSDCWPQTGCLGAVVLKGAMTPFATLAPEGNSIRKLSIAISRC